MITQSRTIDNTTAQEQDFYSICHDPLAIFPVHWQEWVEGSCVSENITELNVKTLTDSYQVRVITHNCNAVKSRVSAIFIKGIQPDMISREVDELLNRNTDKRQKHSDHLVPGWAVSGVEPETGEPTDLGVQFKSDTPPQSYKNGSPEFRSDGTPKLQKYLGASGYDAAPLILDTGITD